MNTADQMSIEDRIRSATQARASLVRDIRPLAASAPLRAPHQRVAGPSSTPAARRLLTWGVPLVAAAAVVLVALSLVAVRPHGTTPPSVGQSITAPTKIPRYYVAIDRSSAAVLTGPENLIVGDDVTGKAIDTIEPPSGIQWISVTGTANDRTFLVLTAASDATKDGGAGWYLLRIAPGSAHPYQLTKLLLGNLLDFAALSPDGKELALESLSNRGGGTTREIKLGVYPIGSVAVYSVASGALLRSWSPGTRVTGGGATSPLSWTANGLDLVFGTAQVGPPFVVQLHTLDVTAPSGDLMSASRPLLTVTSSGPQTCVGMRLTADGTTAICDVQYNSLNVYGKPAGCATHPPGLIAYSVRTAKPVRVVYRYQGPCTAGFAYLLWTDAAAKDVIVATDITQSPSGRSYSGQVRVLADGKSTLLKLPKSVPVREIPVLAF